jgi:uncharacterized damage-inducible protein DinB
MDAIAMTRSLIDHNEWATARLLAAASSLDDATLQRAVAGAGHSSIWGQLRHIAQTQIAWHLGLTGQADSAERVRALMASSDRFDLDTRAGLWRAFETSNTDLREFGQTLSREILERPIAPAQLGSLTVGDTMLHVLTHSAHHRGETAAMLSALGHSPGDVDYLFFALEGRGAGPRR